MLARPPRAPSSTAAVAPKNNHVHHDKFGTVASSPKPNKFFSDISMYSQEPYSFEFLRTPHTVFSFKLIVPIPTNPSLQETIGKFCMGNLKNLCGLVD